jgi:hypothetical protein
MKAVCSPREVAVVEEAPGEEEERAAEVDSEEWETLRSL